MHNYHHSTESKIFLGHVASREGGYLTKNEKAVLKKDVIEFILPPLLNKCPALILEIFHFG